jgi:hypothetical protein
LDGGLLIGGDHIVLRAQRLPVLDPLVQVEHPLCLGLEVGVGDEDPRLVLPGFEGVLGQPSPHRGRRDQPADPGADRRSGQFRARPAGQRLPGLRRWCTGHGLDPADLHRGEHRPPPGPFRIPQRGHPGSGALASGAAICGRCPHRHHPAIPRSARLGVRPPPPARCRPAALGASGADQSVQVPALVVGQLDAVGAGHRHRGHPRSWVPSTPLLVSSVTLSVLVNDTPIGRHHRHGRPPRVDENIPATAVVRGWPARSTHASTMAVPFRDLPSDGPHMPPRVRSKRVAAEPGGTGTAIGPDRSAKGPRARSLSSAAGGVEGRSGDRGNRWAFIAANMAGWRPAAGR